MSDPNVSLFDLDLARALSRSLSGQAVAATELAGPSAEENESFVRFSADRFLPAPPVPPAAAAAAQAPVQAPAQTPVVLQDDTAVAQAPPEPIHFEDWEGLLDWCLEVYRSRAAFVVEPQGFVIANRGSWSFGHPEGVGPQLQTLIQSALEIEDAGRVRFVSFEFDAFWLTGVSAWREGMGDFIIAFLGAERMSSQARDAIHSQVLHNLDRL